MLLAFSFWSYWTLLYKKNPAYRRHWLSQPVRIIALLQKTQQKIQVRSGTPPCFKALHVLARTHPIQNAINPEHLLVFKTLRMWYRTRPIRNMLDPEHLPICKALSIRSQMCPIRNTGERERWKLTVKQNFKGNNCTKWTVHICNSKISVYSFVFHQTNKKLYFKLTIRNKVALRHQAPRTYHIKEESGKSWPELFLGTFK